MERQHPLPVLREPSAEAARVVVPMLLEHMTVERVLDVGCGTGAWLEAFQCERIGLDVHPPGDVSSSIEYHRVDLTQPFKFGSFDLAICLETAEHLPATSAQSLTESLTAAAPVVLFSAAIPHQPGFGHVNCQWPDYWREKFESHGFRQYDPFRASLWDDDRVAWYYRQNLFLYSRDIEFPERRLPDRVVHPDLYENRVQRTVLSQRSLGELIRAVPGVALGSMKRHARR